MTLIWPNFDEFEYQSTFAFVRVPGVYIRRRHGDCVLEL